MIYLNLMTGEELMRPMDNAHVQSNSADVLDDVAPKDSIGGVFNPKNQKRDVDSVLKKRMASDFNELTGNLKPLPLNTTTGL